LIENVEEERERENLHISKLILLKEGNPISSGLDVVFFSRPSLEKTDKSSLERNPSSISSIQLVLDDHMMKDLLWVIYTMYEIREETGVQHCGEEVFLVSSLVGKSNVTKTSQYHVHSHPKVDP